MNLQINELEKADAEIKARENELLKLLVTVGTGGLSILVTFTRLDTLSLRAAFCVAFAWICLGMGVLLA